MKFDKIVRRSKKLLSAQLDTGFHPDYWRVGPKVLDAIQQQHALPDRYYSASYSVSSMKREWDRWMGLPIVVDGRLRGKEIVLVGHAR